MAARILFLFFLYNRNSSKIDKTHSKIKETIVEQQQQQEAKRSTKLEAPHNFTHIELRNNRTHTKLRKLLKRAL